MTQRNGLIEAFNDAIVGDTDETRFLRSTPWIINAHPQDPDELITAMRQQAGRLLELDRQPRFTLLAVLRDTRSQHLKELILSAQPNVSELGIGACR